jgi:NADPH2:quinone reductase
VAGVIDAVGEGVTSLKVGDRVIGWARNGGMAGKMVLPEAGFFPIGEAMPFEEAAAFLMTYGTSHHALRDRAALKAGETLLVLGAAGGVGIAAVELGKAYGARVVAAVSSEEKAAFARAHGADETVVYPGGALDRDAQKALSDRLKQACGEGGADVILDPVGGDYAEPALRAIGWEGRYLVVGFPSGIPKIPLNLTLLKGCQIVGVFWGEFIRREPVRHAANVAELLDLYAAGKLHPVVSATYPLERGGDAIAHFASRKAVGKVVVVI